MSQKDFYRTFILVLTFLKICFFSSAYADEWKSYFLNGEKVIDLRIVSSVDGTGNLDKIPLSLEVIASSGWKIYWKNPGGPGLPPEIFLEASQNVKKMSFLWPSPKRFTFQDIESFGYEGEIVFPIDLYLSQKNEFISFLAKINILACKDICIQIEKKYDFYLSKKPALVNNHARKRAEYLSLVPVKKIPPNVQLGNITLNEKFLIINKTNIGNIDYDIFTDEIIGFTFGRPYNLDKNIIIPIISDFNYKELIGKKINLTFVSEKFNFEIQKTIIKGGGDVFKFNYNLLGYFFIALLGGFILNFMPCVLPILAIKLSNIITIKNNHKSRIRISFLLSAAGIITAFFMLSIISIFIRNLGFQISWGMQFQQPIFLIIMSIIIFIFSINMIGFFHINLPNSITKIFGKQYSGYYGDFFNGFSATILATPCSAPFIGTALTFAFNTNNFSMVMIFMLMGIGLASPWILVGFFPEIISIIPKPGIWMLYLKRILGLGLLITSFWLLSIFGGSLKNFDKEITLQRSDYPVINWQKDIQKKYLEKGKTVLVDITADWCITCQINKIFVLQSPQISKMILNGDLIFISGDWTLPNEEILNYITSYNRFGIPFNVLYGPNAHKGILLPEILTINKLREKINQISF